ncbi:MAG: hypothetical protein R8M11_02890 [Gallionella sp.]
MKNLNVILAVLIVLLCAGCSSEAVKHTTYETLQNVKEQNCRQDPSMDCEKRETYNDYQHQREGLDM